jgi:DNA-binding NtrC family response regulator
LCKILIVDDEEAVRAAVERRLAREGYKVDTASGEAEAVQLIESADPSYDIVLTDMVMENPDSGVKILTSALTEDIFTEVLVLTAYGNVANAVECMKRGAFDYVEKNIPGVDVYDLMSLKVAQAMERRRSSVGTIRRLDQIARTTGKGNG